MNLPCGLANLGNTCFLNSCVQILIQIEELGIIREFAEGVDESQVFSAFVELQNAMKSETQIVNPMHFVMTIHRVAHIKKRNIFTGWAQNDLQEFLLFIIECMHNSKKRAIHVQLNGTVSNETDDLAIKCYTTLKHNYEKGDYSEIADLFNGVFVSRLFTPDGTHLHSTRPEIYSILDLPIPSQTARSNLHLMDCLDVFVDDEIVQDWENETSRTVEPVKKNIAFWSFPKILIITLKRYSPDGQSKNDAFVDFPIDDLDLSKYVIGYKPASYNYKLFGVANHMGGVNGGHYTAFVNCFSGTPGEKWICCNDSAVFEIDKSSVVSALAYCLFYRKTGLPR